MKPVWEGRKVVVCVGTGGVGKTTASASLGIAAACSGLRTLVMTIDPARRLANALGIMDLGNVAREIPKEHLAAYGVELKAPLSVMMPDVKRTFDGVIERSAPDEERRQMILNNRIYQHFSNALAGSHEYAAVEKLYEMYSAGKYDLIVLDTPPSQNAVDFLKAPGRILDFLENETLQWLLKPYVLSGKFSLKFFDFGSSFMLRTLGKLAGGDTLRELAEFVLAFQGMYDGFRERSRKVRALMKSDEMAFVLVTATAPSQLRAMTQFRRELQNEGMRVRSVVLNRVRRQPPEPAVYKAFREHSRRVLASRGEATVGRVLGAMKDEILMSEIDHLAVRDLHQRLKVPLVLLPELSLDVHDLEGLAQLYSGFLHNNLVEMKSDKDLK